MEFKRLDKRKGSGAASIRSRYAYLIHLPDIDYFPETNEKGVRLEGDIVLKDGRTMIPVYLTNPSQEYSYDTQGADDEKTFRVKFTGTHPGTELEALEFSKNLIEESFLILIPSCDKNTPGKLLGQIENPMIFTSTHKAAKDGDKFTFSFEQRIGSEFIYFSYGGIISLPPGGDDPDIPIPPSPGFDPTKWARRDASNIDGDNVLLWREALRIYNESRILTLGSITATTTTIDLAVHSSGVNSVQLDGEVLAKSTADHWEFAEVTAEEVFIIYATNSTEIFQLAENGMEIPADALIVATITISETGISIDEAVSGFREKAIDKWANLIASGGDMVLSLHHNQMRYRVSSGASNVRIGGFKNYVTDLLYSGIPLSIKNNTEGDIEFFNAVDASPFFIPIYSADLPFKIKKGETANFAWHTDNGFEIIKTGGGGGAELPPGTNGQIYEIDNSVAEKIKPSDRLTNVENEIDAEIVNRAADDLLEKNERIAADNAEALARANADALKLDKPTTVIPYTEYLVGLDLNGDSTMISAGDLSFTSAFFTWNLTYMIPHSETTYSTLKTGNPILMGASASPERLSKAIRFSSSGATIAFQRGGVMLISVNSGIGAIELITQRKFLVETNINTQRVFVGISNNYGTTNPVNNDFSALINTVGVILRESSPNWHFIHNNATGAPVITDTGLSHSSTHSFTWYFTRKNGVEKMILEKQSLATGEKEIAETTLTKFNDQILYYHALFCVDKNETNPVRMLDFGAILQTKGFYL